MGAFLVCIYGFYLNSSATSDSQKLLEAIEIAIDKNLKAKKEQKDVNEIRNLLKKLTPSEYETFRWLITGMLNK